MKTVENDRARKPKKKRTETQEKAGIIQTDLVDDQRCSVRLRNVRHLDLGLVGNHFSPFDSKLGYLGRLAVQAAVQFHSIANAHPVRSGLLDSHVDRSLHVQQSLGSHPSGLVVGTTSTEIRRKRCSSADVHF